MLPLADIALIISTDTLKKVQIFYNVKIICSLLQFTENLKKLF